MDAATLSDRHSDLCAVYDCDDRVEHFPTTAIDATARDCATLIDEQHAPVDAAPELNAIVAHKVFPLDALRAGGGSAGSASL